ncbi:MAG: hypothetical protein ACRYFW_07065 [Janthinobacterium lividum]
METICPRPVTGLVSKRRSRLIPLPAHHARKPMPDIIYTAIALGLVGLTLAFVRLCDNA